MHPDIWRDLALLRQLNHVRGRPVGPPRRPSTSSGRSRRAEKNGKNAQGETAMRDYFETVKNFSAADVERRVLAGSLADGVNACVECCNRWAKDGAIALE